MDPFWGCLQPPGAVGKPGQGPPCEGFIAMLALCKVKSLFPSVSFLPSFSSLLPLTTPPLLPSSSFLLSLFLPPPPPTAGWFSSPPAILLSQNSLSPPHCLLFIYTLFRKKVREWLSPSIHCEPPSPLPLAETQSVNSFWLLIKSSLSLRAGVLHKLIAAFLIKSYLLLEP